MVDALDLGLGKGAFHSFVQHCKSFQLNQLRKPPIFTTLRHYTPIYSPKWGLVYNDWYNGTSSNTTAWHPIFRLGLKMKQNLKAKAILRKAKLACFGRAVLIVPHYNLALLGAPWLRSFRLPLRQRNEFFSRFVDQADTRKKCPVVKSETADLQSIFNAFATCSKLTH